MLAGKLFRRKLLRIEEKQYLYYISIAVSIVFLTYRAPSLVVSDIRSESKWLLVRVRLLAMPRVALSAVITRLMSKRLRSGKKTQVEKFMVGLFFRLKHIFQIPVISKQCFFL